MTIPASLSVLVLVQLQYMSCKGVNTKSRSFAGAIVSANNQLMRGQPIKSVAAKSAISCAHVCLANSKCFYKLQSHLRETRHVLLVFSSRGQRYRALLPQEVCVFPISFIISGEQAMFLCIFKLLKG